MATLLMRLAGPLQSWGTMSRFRYRETGSEPSKSGVIGLLCAALGRGRDAPLEDLVALRMGVRIDRPGKMLRDFHTVGGRHLKDEEYGLIDADTGRLKKNPLVTYRYYLTDASFLVGLEGDDSQLIEQLNAALKNPARQLSLGRKACVPGMPIHLPDTPPLGPGISEKPLREALESYPWLDDGRVSYRDDDVKREHLRVILDTRSGNSTQIRSDVPISFARRQIIQRYVETIRIPKPEEVVCFSHV